MAWLSVDPEHRDDRFYRYKMEALEVKREGRGNGAQTAIMNLKNVARDLETPVEAVARHFKFHLGMSGAFRDGRYVFRGHHSVDDLTESLYLYITEIVLCANCRSPETYLGGKRRLKRGCKACGYKAAVESNLRVVDFLHKTTKK